MKALVLFSGGLDSLLAMKIIKDSGVGLFALNFASPFCRCNRGDGCSAVVQIKRLGIEHQRIELKEEYLDIVAQPKFGRGRNMNPCLDCRILMFKKAKKIMQDIGASFIVTGEVLGQRPMSQQRRQLATIERESGLSGLILRPLCAKLLPQSLPEKQGWVKREMLLDFSGRMRTPQMEKAKALGLKDYPCPSGGCLLTDEGFSRRVKDLLQYNQFSLENVELLKLGRHFRLSDKLKLIVGRNEGENRRLLNLAKDGDICFTPQSIAGPTALARGLNGQMHIERLCASIVVRYSDLKDTMPLAIDRWRVPENKRETILQASISEPELENLRI